MKCHRIGAHVSVYEEHDTYETASYVHKTFTKLFDGVVVQKKHGDVVVDAADPAPFPLRMCVKRHLVLPLSDEETYTDIEAKID